MMMKMLEAGGSACDAAIAAVLANTTVSDNCDAALVPTAQAAPGAGCEVVVTLSATDTTRVEITASDTDGTVISMTLTTVTPASTAITLEDFQPAIAVGGVASGTVTVGSDEVRAWTIRRGTNARKAAGKIHSDLERGFIRAEVVAFEALEEKREIKVMMYPNEKYMPK